MHYYICKRVLIHFCTSGQHALFSLDFLETDLLLYPWRSSFLSLPLFLKPPTHYHIMFQAKEDNMFFFFVCLFVCLFVCEKEDRNEIRTDNHLVRKQTLNHLGQFV